MKKYILGLLGLAFLKGAAALAQVPVPVGPPAPPPGAIGPDCCPSHGCCGPHQCVPQPYLKVTKHVVFTSGCEALCLPPCCGCCLFKGCGGCGEGHCGHAYNVRYLVKKRHVCEEEATKCVPVPCGHGLGCVPPSVGAPAPVGEPLAPPKVLPNKK